MSNAALTWAFEQDIADPICKFVLVALANRLNGETGRLDPSIDTLRVDVGRASRRTVEDKLQKLKRDGLIAITRRGPTTSSYELLMSNSCASSEPNDEQSTHEDVQILREDEQSTTAHIDKPEEPEEPEVRARARPSKSSSSKRDQLLLPLLRVLSRDHAEAVVDHRLGFKKSSFTPRAAELLAARLAKAPVECSLSPDQAADEMIERGWQGFKPDWINNAKARDRAAPGKGSARPPPKKETAQEYAFRMLEESINDDAADDHPGLLGTGEPH